MDMFDITQDTGVKGASALCVHRHFDLCKGVVVDVMHCVFLGVISKTLLKFWLDVRYRAAPFSMRSKVSTQIYIYFNLS